MRETERDSKMREHKQGEWEREKQASRGAGNLMQGLIPGPWDHDPSWRQMLNDWATQAPQEGPLYTYMKWFPEYIVRKDSKQYLWYIIFFFRKGGYMDIETYLLILSIGNNGGLLGGSDRQTALDFAQVMISGSRDCAPSRAPHCVWSLLKILSLRAPGWLSGLSLYLQLRSWSQGPGIKPHIGLSVQQGACFPPPPTWGLPLCLLVNSVK